jgi:hypothetical protein
VRVVVDRGQEQDRHVPGALAALDVLGGLEAVHAGHVGVEQDHREVVDQQLLERVLAAADGDDLDGQPLEDRLQRHEVLAAVVDGQHLRPGRSRRRPRPRASPAPAPTTRSSPAARRGRRAW